MYKWKAAGVGLRFYIIGTRLAAGAVSVAELIITV